MSEAAARHIELVTVLGAVTPPGRLHRAIVEASTRVRSRGIGMRELDLRTLELGFADGRDLHTLTDDTPATVEALTSAHGVVLATPVYRASMTGALKNLLDLAPVAALRAKPVGIVAMGGSQHHFLGAASHLRDVLAWFGALPAPVDVYLTGADFEDGTPTAEAAAALDGLFNSVAALAVATRDLELGPSPLAAKYY